MEQPLTKVLIDGFSDRIDHDQSYVYVLECSDACGRVSYPPAPTMAKAFFIGAVAGWNVTGESKFVCPTCAKVQNIPKLSPLYCITFCDARTAMNEASFSTPFFEPDGLVLLRGIDCNQQQEL